MDGLSLKSKEGAEIDIGGMNREAAIADGIVADFTEEPVPAQLTATLLHGAQSDLIKIRDATNVTIVFSSDTGVKYVMRGAWCSKPPKLKGGKGECDVEFQGPPAIQS